MREVHFESTAFGDVLVDENGDPLTIIPESDSSSVELQLSQELPWLEPASDIPAGAFIVREQTNGQFVWRELVFKMKREDGNWLAPDIDMVMADTRTGWLLDPTLEDLGLPDFDWGSVPAALAQRPFIPLDTNEAAGITQPDLAGDPNRYFCSYAHNASGFVAFRGFFVAAAAGSSLIGILEEEYRPPYTVRMVGVREDETPFTVRVEPNGEIYSSGHQMGNNHLDGCSFYEGEGPVVIMATFAYDPADPYRVKPGVASGSFAVIGSGILHSDNPVGTLTFDLPVPELPFDAYDVEPDYSGVTYTVISGPNAGQSGWASSFGWDSSTNSLEISISPMLDGEVRVTFDAFTLIPVAPPE